MQSFLTRLFARDSNPRARPAALPPAARANSLVPCVVALGLAEHDRELLAGIARQSRMDVRFADSCGEAWNTAEHCAAPVVLFDRDLPAAEWRDVVRLLSSAPHHPSVVLISRVVDDYLWHEVIRLGGYDVLAKPLHSEAVVRSLRLALSYWRATSMPMHAAHG